MSPAEACKVVCAALSNSTALLPSIYFERGGLLRCQCQQGYWQVLDGIPTTSGVMARGYRSGARVIVDDVTADPDFLAAVPFLRSEVVEPLKVGGRVIGCLNVESRQQVGGDDLARIHRAARLLSERLDQLGVVTEESALARLARSSKELSGLSDRLDIERAVVRLACEVSDMSSSALYLPADPAMVAFRAAQGPLATAFRDLDPATVKSVAEQIGSVSSCHAGDQEGGSTVEGIEQLRRAGAASVAVLPLQLLGRGTGLLVTADHSPMRMGTEHVEALELLASEAAPPSTSPAS